MSTSICTVQHNSMQTTQMAPLAKDLDQGSDWWQPGVCLGQACRQSPVTHMTSYILSFYVQSSDSPGQIQNDRKMQSVWLEKRGHLGKHGTSDCSNCGFTATVQPVTKQMHQPHHWPWPQRSCHAAGDPPQFPLPSPGEMAHWLSSETTVNHISKLSCSSAWLNPLFFNIMSKKPTITTEVKAPPAGTLLAGRERLSCG